MRHLIAIPLLLVAVAAQAQFMPEKLTPLGEKIEAAMKSDIRTAEEKARDAERKPRQKLEFMGLREDMRVVELIPSGGWFTKILGPVLADKGELYVAIGTERAVAPLIKNTPSLSKVKIAATDAKMVMGQQMGFFDMEVTTLGVTDADLVVTFRNLHNLSAAGRANLNKAVWKALKPGGLYGIVDHTRRHNEPANPENGRRLDPVLTIKEIQDAGFILDRYSNLLYKPDDELRYEVGRKSVTGNSDRFLMVFRKVGN
jgi:predicted methyltransferase